MHSRIVEPPQLQTPKSLKSSRSRVSTSSRYSTPVVSKKRSRIPVLPLTPKEISLDLPANAIQDSLRLEELDKSQIDMSLSPLVSSMNELSVSQEKVSEAEGELKELYPFFFKVIIKNQLFYSFAPFILFVLDGGNEARDLLFGFTVFSLTHYMFLFHVVEY